GVAGGQPGLEHGVELLAAVARADAGVADAVIHVHPPQGGVGVAPRRLHAALQRPAVAGEAVVVPLTFQVVLLPHRSVSAVGGAGVGAGGADDALLVAVRVVGVVGVGGEEVADVGEGEVLEPAHVAGAGELVDLRPGRVVIGVAPAALVGVVGRLGRVARQV